MNKNLPQKTRGYPIRLALLIAGLLLSLGFAFFVSLLHPDAYAPALIIVPVVISLGMTAALILYFNLNAFFAVRRLHQAVAGPMQAEIDSLKLSLAELARGNLNVRTSEEEAGTKGKSAGAADGDSGGQLIASELLGRLLAAHRQIIAHIRESKQEFNQVTAPPCRRLCYVGADSFQEGKKCGSMMGRALLGKGTVAVIMGSAVSSGQSLRRKGFQAALKEEYPDIRIIVEREDHENQEQAEATARELLAAFPDLTGIYICHGTTPHTVARTAELLRSARPVRIVTHDLTPDTMDCIVRGSITGTLSQNPFAQGYDPVVEAYNYLVSGEEPLIVRRLTLIEEVTRENYTTHWEDGRGALLSEKASASLARPLANTKNKSCKIGVILPDDTGFWAPVAAGVRRAMETLLQSNTIVMPILNESIRNMDWRAEVFIPVIQRLIDDGCQAVCLPLFDPALITFINQITAAGVAIFTYNSEPVSLRGMVDAVRRHAEHLYEISEGLAAHATENSQAVSQITATMKLLLVGSLNQIQHLSRTDELIQSLIGLIGKVREEIIEGIQTAGVTKGTAQTGYDIVRRTQEVMKALDRNARVTDEAIHALNANVIKINEITGFIDGLTAQTNLLAINASIQATQAGAEGKGFNVVAQEIRSLAEQAAKATADISELITAILTGVERATASVGASTEQVARSVTIADHTEAVFREITAASAENETKIEGILLKTEGMLGMSEQVQAAMSELNRVNQENGAAVEETTTSVMEMSGAINKIGEAARLLKNMGQSQDELLAQFIIE